MTRSARATAAAPSPAEPPGQVRDWADDPLVPFRFRRGDTEVEVLRLAGAVEAAKLGRVVPVTIVFGDTEVHTARPAGTAGAAGRDREQKEWPRRPRTPVPRCAPSPEADDAPASSFTSRHRRTVSSSSISPRPAAPARSSTSQCSAPG